MRVIAPGGDILVKNPVKLQPTLPVLARNERHLGHTFDYKPSLTVLHNAELLMALRHQNGSDAQLHAIFMRSSDAGVSWRRETPVK